MEFLNYIIKLPNKVMTVKTEENTEESASLSQIFSKEMEKLFRMVESQNNVIAMKDFDPRNPNKSTENAKLKEK